jgi:hypothetical protein
VDAVGLGTWVSVDALLGACFAASAGVSVGGMSVFASVGAAPVLVSLALP